MERKARQHDLLEMLIPRSSRAVCLSLDPVSPLTRSNDGLCGGGDPLAVWTERWRVESAAYRQGHPYCRRVCDRADAVGEYCRRGEKITD